jgi:hypothetical protein
VDGLKHAKLLVMILHEAVGTRNLTKFMVLLRKLMELSREHQKIIEKIVYLLDVFYALKPQIIGYEFLVVGTIGRHGRSQTMSYKEGSLKMSTLYNSFDYSNVQCVTPYGCVNMKLTLSYVSLQPLAALKKDRST